MKEITSKNPILSFFDAHGGDCGCQFRASILVEMISKFNPLTYEFFVQQYEKALRIKERLENIDPELFLYQAKQALGKGKPLTLEFTLKHHSLAFDGMNGPNWDYFCYLSVAYYLAGAKDKNGLTCVKNHDRALIKYLQAYITKLSVEHIEGLARRSFKDLTFYDFAGRATIPVRIAFDYLWPFWTQNFPLFFRITRFHENAISFHYLTIHDGRKGDADMLNQLNKSTPCILLDCISSAHDITHVHSFRNGATCLGFDTKKITKVQDKNMEKLLKSLSIDGLKELLDYFFASHPQLINQSFSDSNENAIEKVVPGFKEQIQSESDLADKNGCSKKRISLFAPEHIYCETVYGIEKRFSLPMSIDERIFSPDDEKNFITSELDY